MFRQEPIPELKYANQKREKDLNAQQHAMFKLFILRISKVRQLFFFFLLKHKQIIKLKWICLLSRSIGYLSVYLTIKNVTLTSK